MPASEDGVNDPHTGGIGNPRDPYRTGSEHDAPPTPPVVDHLVAHETGDLFGRRLVPDLLGWACLQDMA